MSLLNRRDFLATTSLAVAGMTLGAQSLPASRIQYKTASHFLPEPMAGESLRTLAAQAIDAARSAGAQYADVRFSENQTLRVSLLPGGIPTTTLGSVFSYGIRVMVDGAMAFEYGNLPTSDAIVSTVRNAVTQARGFATLSDERVELAPAPVVTGIWESPVQIDPFAVPILEQADLLVAFGAAASGRVEGAAASGSFSWQRETRVVATSEGTMTTQVFNRARPSLGVVADWMTRIFHNMPHVSPMMRGYEAMLDPDLQPRIKAYAEQLQRYAKLPARMMDVGRYPIVLDGHATSMMLSSTLSPALQLDRAVGNEADAAGSTFLAPVDDVYGKSYFSPLLSVTCGRPLTDITGARWDDEGVEPRTFPVIQEGKVVDYMSDRQTAPALRDWYSRQGKPAESRGCAMAWDAHRPVLVGSGHLTMAHAPSDASLDDLCHDMERGLVALQAYWISTDQQLGSGQLHTSLLLEVRKGKIVNRVRDAALQFTTERLWRSLDALGGASTVQPASQQLYKGQPWQPADYGSTTPAGRFKEIDLIQIGARS